MVNNDAAFNRVLDQRQVQLPSHHQGRLLEVFSQVVEQVTENCYNRFLRPLTVDLYYSCSAKWTFTNQIN